MSGDHELDAAVCPLFLVSDFNLANQRNESLEQDRLRTQQSDSALVIHGLDSELRDEDLHEPSSAAAETREKSENMIVLSENGKSSKGQTQLQVLDFGTVLDRCGGDLELLKSVMERSAFADVDCMSVSCLTSMATVFLSREV